MGPHPGRVGLRQGRVGSRGNSGGEGQEQGQATGGRRGAGSRPPGEPRAGRAWEGPRASGPSSSSAAGFPNVLQLPTPTSRGFPLPAPPPRSKGAEPVCGPLPTAWGTQSLLFPPCQGVRSLLSSSPGSSHTGEITGPGRARDNLRVSRGHGQPALNVRCQVELSSFLPKLLPCS